jgi:hypothetical protein
MTKPPVRHRARPAPAAQTPPPAPIPILATPPAPATLPEPSAPPPPDTRTRHARRGDRFAAVEVEVRTLAPRAPRAPRPTPSAAPTPGERGPSRKDIHELRSSWRTTTW